MVICNLISRFALCMRSVCRVVAAEVYRLLPGDESEQFLLLCADFCACAASAGRLGGADLRYSQARQVGTATQSTGGGRAILAFYGLSMGVFDLAAVDQGIAICLTGSTIGRRLEFRGFDDRWTFARCHNRTAIFDSNQETGDVAIHYRRHHDLCRVSGGLRIPPEWNRQLAAPFPQHQQ